MSDIVERLRLRASGGPAQGQLDDEAADEIDRLKAALREIAAGFNHDGNWCRVRARAALEEKP